MGDLSCCNPHRSSKCEPLIKDIGAARHAGDENEISH